MEGYTLEVEHEE